MPFLLAEICEHTFLVGSVSTWFISATERPCLPRVPLRKNGQLARCMGLDVANYFHA